MIYVTSTDELRRAALTGGEIVLGDGHYGPVRCDVPGTVLRADHRWQAVIYGDHRSVEGIYCAGLHCTVDGIAVRRAGLDGIKIEAGGQVVNCWVSHAARNGIASHNELSEPRVEITSNLVEFCGSHIQFDHGIYANGTGLRVSGNVVRHCSGFGLHLYPVVKRSRVHHNLVYRQSSGRGVIVDSAGDNVFARNTIVEQNIAVDWWRADQTDQVIGNVLCGRLLGVPVADNWLGNEDAAGFVSYGRNLFWPRSNAAVIGRGALDYDSEREYDLAWPYAGTAGWHRRIGLRTEPPDEPPTLDAEPSA